jgi:hypothetical protein
MQAFVAAGHYDGRRHVGNKLPRRQASPARRLSETGQTASAGRIEPIYEELLNPSSLILNSF